MTYAEKQLAPDEKILYRAKYHWIFYGRAIVFLLLSIAASALTLVLESKGAGPTPSKISTAAAAAFLVIALVLFTIRGLRARADEFVVTDRRILHKVGIFAHETRQCPLERIQDVTVDQSFWGRLLGYGDLGIETASERGQILFPTIRNPEALRTAIWTHVGPGGVSSPHAPGADRPSGPPGPGAPGRGSAADRLAQLNDLRNKGLLTPEEFEAKRRDVVMDL
jgi:membrane protein YdbS with pleckstrin-like domain